MDIKTKWPGLTRAPLLALVAAVGIGAAAPSQAMLLLDVQGTVNVVSGTTGSLNPAGVSPALTTPPVGTTGPEITFELNSSGSNTITFSATNLAGDVNIEDLEVVGGGQSGVAPSDGLTPGLAFVLTEGVRRLELNPDINFDGNYLLTIDTNVGSSMWEVELNASGQNRVLTFSDPLDSLLILGGSIVSLDAATSEIVDLIQPRFGGVCDDDCDPNQPQVSEPGTLAALGLGVIGLGLIRRTKSA